MLKDFFFSVFSKDEINTGRQPELDWFKAKAVLTMILGHVEEVIFSNCWEDYAFCRSSNVNIILRAFLMASIAFGFMTVMGASILYSRHTKPEELIDRGKRLIAAWIVLKLLYIVPLSYVFAGPSCMTYVEFGLRYLFSNDILCFAGLFFLYYGFLKKGGWPFIKILILSVAIFLAGQFIRIPPTPGMPMVDALIGIVLPTFNTSFPFVLWLPAPIVGLVWGYGLRHCRNKDRFYLCIAGAGLVLLGLYILKMYIGGNLNMEGISQLGNPARYYHATVGTTCLSVSLVMLSMGFYYALSRLITWRWLTTVVSFTSRNLTGMYVFQWILIPWLAAIFPRPQHPVGTLARDCAALGIFALSAGCVIISARFAARRKKVKTA